MHVTVGRNSRDDPEKSKEFLSSSCIMGSEMDLLLRGRGCLFDWSLTSFCPEDVWKVFFSRMAVQTNSCLNPNVALAFREE